MDRRVLRKYPAWTNPATPLLAAQTKPVPKTAAGTAYSHEYSGGSVGRRKRSSMRFVIKNPPNMSAGQSPLRQW